MQDSSKEDSLGAPRAPKASLATRRPWRSNIPQHPPEQHKPTLYSFIFIQVADTGPDSSLELLLPVIQDPSPPSAMKILPLLLVLLLVAFQGAAGKVEAWQDPGGLTWSVAIVGPSATGGNALVAMITWAPVVLGTAAVGGCSVANCGESPGVIAFAIVGFKELLQQPPRIYHSPFNKSKRWGGCMAALCGVVIHFQK
ncbi:hypothetical protein EK904_014144 [Melospiza melodia maxima]|nr:hypothetical protein EK904_014144 [Melospiza melodia maxima]